MYTYPDVQFDRFIGMDTLPVRAVAYKGENMVAVGGDAGVIQLKSTTAGETLGLLKDPNTAGGVVSLAFDPEGMFLAAAYSGGCILLWNVEDRIVDHSWTGQFTMEHGEAEDEAEEEAARSPLYVKMDWSPDGRHLALPGRPGVSVVERHSWSKPKRMEREHTDPVSIIRYSPNGRYMATAGLDKKVLVWDVASGEVLASTRANAPLCNMRWHPKENQLALIDLEGEYALWTDPLPDHMHPVKNPITEPIRSGHAVPEFEDTDAIRALEIQQGVSEALKSLGVLSESGELLAKRGGGDGGSGTAGQPAFQPGATPFNENQRRYLAWNGVGVVTSRVKDFESFVEVEFFDTGLHRPIRFGDHYNHSMAALDTEAVIFASNVQDDVASAVFYRPLNGWAANSEWTLFLDKGEDARAVAVGAGWAAVATDKQYVRVLTVSGVQRQILSLPGPVVTMVGNASRLAVVYHAPDSSGDRQHLVCMVYDVALQKRIMRETLPLGKPDADLTWLGFTELGFLAFCDSTDIVRVLVEAWDNEWTPVLDLDTVRKGNELHFITNVTDTAVMAVSLKGQHFPSVNPRPTPITLEMKIPLMDYGSVALERDFLAREMASKQLALAYKAAGLDEPASVKADKVEMDKVLIKMINSACKAERSARALDLVRLLSLEQSYNIAGRLAHANNMPALQARIDEALQEFYAREAGEEIVEEEHVEEVEERIVYVDRPAPVRRQRAPVREVEMAEEDEADEAEVEEDADEEEEDAAEVKAKGNPFVDDGADGDEDEDADEDEDEDDDEEAEDSEDSEDLSDYTREKRRKAAEEAAAAAASAAPATTPAKPETETLVATPEATEGKKKKKAINPFSSKKKGPKSAAASIFGAVEKEKAKEEKTKEGKKRLGDDSGASKKKKRARKEKPKASSIFASL